MTPQAICTRRSDFSRVYYLLYYNNIASILSFIAYIASILKLDVKLIESVSDLPRPIKSLEALSSVESSL